MDNEHIKNCVLKLQCETQVAHRGYFCWEDCIQMVEVFPPFQEIIKLYWDVDMETLKGWFITEGFTLKYEHYKENELKYMRWLSEKDQYLYKEFMYE